MPFDVLTKRKPMDNTTRSLVPMSHYYKLHIHIVLAQNWINQKNFVWIRRDYSVYGVYLSWRGTLPITLIRNQQ